MPFLQSLDLNKFALIPSYIIDVPLVPSDESTGSLLLCRVGVHGDGSCFFHALAYALNYDNYAQAEHGDQQKKGRELRAMIQSVLTDDSHEAWTKFRGCNSDINDADFRHVNDKLKEPTAWVDHIIIKYVCHILLINIIFIDEQARAFYCDMPIIAGRPFVIILWINGNHFEPVLQIDSLVGSEVRMRSMFDDKMGNTIKSSLIKAFELGCSIMPTPQQNVSHCTRTSLPEFLLHKNLIALSEKKGNSRAFDTPRMRSAA